MSKAAMTALPYPSAFKPTSITGCSLWLDAADATTITGTTSITAWGDKSGNNNNPTFSGTNPSYVAASNAIISANGNQNFTVPEATLATSTGSGSLFFVYGDQQTQGSYSALFGTSTPFHYLFQSLLRPDGNHYQYNNINPDSTLTSVFNTTSTLLYNMNYTYGTTTGSLRLNGTNYVSSYIWSVVPSGALSLSSTGFGSIANLRLYEVIIYKGATALTTAQCQQVEGYLAWKWGLQANLPGSHPYAAAAPITSNSLGITRAPAVTALVPTVKKATTALSYYATFAPTSIAGCQLWLDGADQSSASMTLSGTNVTAWNDKSGNGRHLSATSAYPTITPNGLLFNGATPNVLSNAASFAVVNGLTSFVVFNSTVASSRQRVFMYVYTGQNIGYTADTTYNSVFSSTVGGDGPVSYSTNTTYIYGGNTFAISPFISHSENTVESQYPSTYTVNPSTQTQLLVGGQSTVYFTGTIKEVILFDAFLTTAQRQTVEGYLAWKWGLQAKLAFTPLSIPGCSLWLDASDSTTITGTITVTAWTDKSGKGNNAAFDTNKPSYTPANNYVETSNNNTHIRLPAAAFTNTTNQTCIIFIVYADKQTGTSTNPTQILFSTLDYGFYQFLSSPAANTRYNIRGNMSLDADYIAFKNRLATTNTVFHSIQYTAQVTNAANYFGAPYGNYWHPTAANSQQVTGDVYLGGMSNADGDFHANLKIYEVLVYNNVVLTTAQRQTVEGYLAWKWGVQSSLPTFASPTSVSGCVLWLDAADVTTLTVSGGAVSQWNDKSGNGNNATQSTSGNQPISGTITQNGLNVLNLTSKTMTYPTISLTTMTVFCVYRQLDFTSYRQPLSVGEFAFFYASGGLVGIGRLAVTGEVSANYSTYGITSSVYTIYGGTVSISGSTTTNMYFNGTNVASNTVNSSGGIVRYEIGRSELTNSGYIAEVLLYNTVLTTSQRQQVEGYLAWKWGLQSYLSTSHPYYTISPNHPYLSATPTGHPYATAAPLGASLRPAAVTALVPTPTKAITAIAKNLPVVATGGDTVTTANGTKIHSFLTVGTQQFTLVDNPMGKKFRVLIVGGGGGGGSPNDAGGGGAGGLVYNSNVTLSPGTYNIVVGAGGAGLRCDIVPQDYPYSVQGNSGSNSSAFGLIGYGGGGGGGGMAAPGLPGGCGGGGSFGDYPGAGGAALQAGGYPGASGYCPPCFGGGGGGMGGTGYVVGGESSCGGAGVQYNISGTMKYYAAGGGGGTDGGTPPIGGSGIGGTGGYRATSASYIPTSGAANTGSGGGGHTDNFSGGSALYGGGGSGVVIIAYVYP